MLLLYAITLFIGTSTLRDILLVRMRGFTQVLFFGILSDTLVLYRSQLGVAKRRLNKTIARLCSNSNSTRSCVSTVCYSIYRGSIK